MKIERVIRTVLMRALPARVASDAVDDLLDDHRRIRQSRGALSATLYLIREASSLLASRIVDAVARLLRSPVFWRRDLTHAVRALVRRPWSSASAILMLAAGLAAVASSAGLASALLFRSISARYPNDVARLASADVAGRTRLAFSEPELERIREHIMAAGASLAVANLQPVVLRSDDTDTQTLAEVIGGRYFDIIGLDVAVGRPLVEGDAAAGAPPVMVISDTLWRDRFGRDPAAVGTTMGLNGRAFTIVGVTSGTSTSSLLGGSVDAWITVAHAGAMLDRDWRTNAERRWWTTIVHFNPGAGARSRGIPPAAESPEFAAVLGRATADLAARLPAEWRERRMITLPGSVLTGTQRTAAATLSLVLNLFAALILAAAAANAGGVFLAAAAAERGRAAIQLAVGSGRSAIVRRHLMEGGILGAGAGIAALALYAWVRRQLADIALLPTLSLRLDLPFDARIGALTIGAGVLAGVLLALGPSLWMTRLDLAQTLRDGSGRSGGGAGLSKARRLLVAAQVAISIVLVAGASLFARSMERLDVLDVGFPRHGLIAMDFDLEPPAPSAILPALAREALDRAQAIPGVVAASMASRAPIDSSTPRLAVAVPGSRGRVLDDVTFYAVTERYFDTLGLPVVRGRAFTAADGARANDVVIVNETLARQLWPEGDALDRPLFLPSEQRTVRVVGIARDSKYRSLSEAPRPHLYRPAPPGFSLALLVRTQDDPRRTILAVQEALDRIGPGVVGFFPRTLDDHLSIDMLTTRASARASATLGVFALSLSAVGLYGIVMWFVEVRRREIGVRLALGASANQVRRLVVSQAMVAAAPGIAVGLVMAIALTAIGRSLFVGIGAIDPVSLVVGIVTFGAIVVAASYLPSRRATQVDPVIVLRDW